MPKQKEDEKKKIIDMSEISISLDTYDDIFSDFDPRPYSQRSLSGDFLTEAKNAAKEKTTGKVELRFMIPSAVSDPKQEVIIIKRLRDHFRKHYREVKKDYNDMLRKGFTLIFVGFFLIISAGLISIHEPKTFLLSILFLIFEPAGWFTTWSGLDRIFFLPETKKHNMKFYKKMSEADISFMTY